MLNNVEISAIKIAVKKLNDIDCSIEEVLAQQVLVKLLEKEKKLRNNKKIE
jgi:hypothetical protein